MAAEFDPYADWLKIPSERRPPTFYDLLGIAPLESDLASIHTAAEDRIVFLRSLQMGPQRELVLRLIGEVSKAAAHLTHAQQKQAYDAQLLRDNPKSQPPATAEPVVQKSLVAVVETKKAPHQVVHSGTAVDAEVIEPPSRRLAVLAAPHAAMRGFFLVVRQVDRALGAVVGDDSEILHNFLRVLTVSLAIVFAGLSLLGAQSYVTTRREAARVEQATLARAELERTLVAQQAAQAAEAESEWIAALGATDAALLDEYATESFSRAKFAAGSAQAFSAAGQPRQATNAYRQARTILDQAHAVVANSLSEALELALAKNDRTAAAALLAKARIFMPEDTRTASYNDRVRKMYPVSAAHLHTLVGHRGDVIAAAFSHDGRLALTGSRDKVAKLWDTSTGRQLCMLEGHTDAVSCVTFDTTGQLALTGSQDHTAILWELAAGRVVRKFEGHTAKINTVAFSSDGQRLLTGSSDRSAILWDAMSGKSIRTFRHPSGSTAAALSTDGGQVLVGCSSGSVILWNAATGEQLKSFWGVHYSAVLFAAFSADGRRLHTAAQDKSATTWFISGTQPQKLQGTGESVTALAFNPDRRQMLAGTNDSAAASIWDAKTGVQLQSLNGHYSNVTAVAFSPDGLRAISGSADQTAIVWDLKAALANSPSLAPAITNSVGMELNLIPAGQFLMGSPPGEDQRQSGEVQHTVKITKPFYLGVYEVTQEEYSQVMDSNPSEFSPTGYGKNRLTGLDTSRLPVERVTWENAAEFCKRLSARESRAYRLPTEAEWEYACRAGTTTPFHWGTLWNSSHANCTGSMPYGRAAGVSLNRTQIVGSYPPNAFGLYDMHGNVREMCADWYGPYSTGVSVDPQGPASGSGRVRRGGSWSTGAQYCRAAYRTSMTPSRSYSYVGFRVALTPPASP